MKARRRVPTSSVRATLSHSLPHRGHPERGVDQHRPHRADEDDEDRGQPGILDGVERKRHPGERRDRLQDLDEGIERPAHQRRHADEKADRDGDRDREQIAERHARDRVMRAGCRGPCRWGRCRRTAVLRCSQILAPTSSGPASPICPGVAVAPISLAYSGFMLAAGPVPRGGEVPARAMKADEQQRARRTAARRPRCDIIVFLCETSAPGSRTRFLILKLRTYSSGLAGSKVLPMTVKLL